MHSIGLVITCHVRHDVVTNVCYTSKQRKRQNYVLLAQKKDNYSLSY